MNIQALDKALRLAAAGNQDAAVQHLVSAGMTEDEAKQTLIVATDPRRYAGRV